MPRQTREEERLTEDESARRNSVDFPPPRLIKFA